MEQGKYKITIAGMGYVGMSLAVLLAQSEDVYAYDIDEGRIRTIRGKKSPIHDEYVEKYMQEKSLKLIATSDAGEAFKNADYVIVAVPTDYDSEKNYFNTSAVDNVVRQILQYNRKAVIVLKSTIPVGYTELLQDKYDYADIIFSPEFLRESKALYDNLYPSRIILGTDKRNVDLYQKTKKFGNLLKENALQKDIQVLYMGFREAESVKLFSNTYLALRVAFFNEVDTYAECRGIDAKDIIDGISLDPRIGSYYHNPSFGYGGYCLPKDTKQLLANYEEIPQDIISAVIRANDTRKKHIAEQIYGHLKQKKWQGDKGMVGIYRLTMKKDSDNCRSSSIIGVLEYLEQYDDVSIIIFEPVIDATEFHGWEIMRDIGQFKKTADIIVANRFSGELKDVRDKVYTRDLYQQD